MNVLVINCGSSSLKYQLINSDTEAVLAKGLCERIGIDGRLVYKKAGGEKEITEAPMPTHKEAIQMVLDALTNEKTGAIKSLAYRRLAYLILLSIRQCRRKHISMVCRLIITKTIRSEDMVSMEPPTALFPNVLLNSWAWTKKTQKLLYATWVTDHLSVQL